MRWVWTSEEEQGDCEGVKGDSGEVRRGREIDSSSSSVGVCV